MNLEEIKVLEDKLKQELTSTEKVTICLQLAKEYALRSSSKLDQIIDLSLSVSNINPTEKCTLLFYRLNKSFYDLNINSKVYKELFQTISDHKLGNDELNKLALNEGVLLFKNRDYTKSVSYFK